MNYTNISPNRQCKLKNRRTNRSAKASPIRGGVFEADGRVEKAFLWGKVSAAG